MLSDPLKCIPILNYNRNFSANFFLCSTNHSIATNFVVDLNQTGLKLDNHLICEEFDNW